tara:strand:+ start:1838 stop:1972 length:135 start_codon:yes stop_codon:yes gene_type:complete
MLFAYDGIDNGAILDGYILFDSPDSPDTPANAWIASSFSQFGGT